MSEQITIGAYDRPYIAFNNLPLAQLSIAAQRVLNVGS